MNKERVLLTGATGFIGSHVTRMLLQKGYKLRILTRNKSFTPENSEKIEVRVVDYLNPETLNNVGEDVDYVIHMAGVIKGRRFGVFKRGNIYTTVNLLDKLKSYPIKKFIYLSSQSAAGPSKGRPLVEEDPPDPVSFYGLSKKIAEEKVINSGLPYIILRPSAVFGEGDKETLSLFKMAKLGVSFSIGNGPLFNMIYVKDLVSIILRSMESEIVNTIYFVNNGEVYSPRSLNDALKEVIGKQHTFYIKVPHAVATLVAFLNEYYSGLLKQDTMLTREKMRELKQYAWLASNEKLKREVFSDFTPSKEAFRKTYEWYKAHRWL